MSKNPPSHSREGERERKARQCMSQPLVVPPVRTADVPTPVPTLPQRTKGKTPEECGYPEGQVSVSTGAQGQRLWSLNGHYDMPNRILCFKAGKDTYNPAWADSLT